MKKIVSGYRLILGYLGIFIFVVGVIILLPLVMLIVPSYRETDIVYLWHFLIPGLSSIVIGLGLNFLFLYKKEKAKLGKHQDAILLVSLWIVAILISAIPFFATGELSFTESVFESTSGYAAVGLTRFVTTTNGISQNSVLFESHVFTFYRALTQFFGGVGLVLVVTSAISDKYGLKLYTAEGHNDRLIPNLSKSARLILSMYVGFILLGTISLCIAGVEFFDAMCHSISAVATGGFATKPGGMLEYGGNLIAVEIITEILMILGATNFVLHMFLLLGRFKKVGRDIEIKTFGIVCLIFIPLMFATFFASGLDAWESIRYGTFSFLSCITTTGYTNIADIAIIPSAGFMLLTVCNVIGAGMGSTAGGIKFYRLAIACKSYYWTLRAKLSPRRYIYPNYIVRLGDVREVSKEDSNEAFGYILLYLIVMFVGGFLVSIIGSFDYGKSLFEFSSALSGTGFTNGLTASANYGTLWVLIIGMFAGRLEILIIHYAFYRIARDIFRKETI